MSACQDYTARLVGLYRVFRVAVINIKPQESWYFKYMFIGEPGGFIDAGSLIEAGGSDAIVLIKAGGFY